MLVCYIGLGDLFLGFDSLCFVFSFGFLIVFLVLFGLGFCLWNCFVAGFGFALNLLWIFDLGLFEFVVLL